MRLRDLPARVVVDVKHRGALEHRYGDLGLPVIAGEGAEGQADALQAQMGCRFSRARAVEAEA
jgi:hypothetical protein